MKVRELMSVLEGADLDNEVVICVENPGGYVCPDGAFVNLASANPEGMDWHMGLTELVPANRLLVKNVEAWAKGKRG